MIKYLGSKRLLVPQIVEVVTSLADSGTFLDLFSGTSRVSQAMKAAGWSVESNDWMTYARTLATCYVQAEPEQHARESTELLKHLAALPEVDGYVTETFCRQSRYFQEKNGRRIDAIRTELGSLDLSEEVRAIATTALLEAADRVDSTTGVQMAYLKRWAPRSHRDLELRLPELIPSAPGRSSRSHGMEATEAAATLVGDVAYLDPPYNQHSYLGNYHVWETLARGDEPEHFGVACKRIDCKTRKSPYNSKVRSQDAFTQLVAAVRAPHLVVSFNDEGYLSREFLMETLASRGTVHTLEFEHARYVGARIGIHNPAGERVGKIGHVRNREFLFVTVPDGSTWQPPAALESALVAS